MSARKEAEKQQCFLLLIQMLKGWVVVKEVVESGW